MPVSLKRTLGEIGIRMLLIQEAFILLELNEMNLEGSIISLEAVLEDKETLVQQGFICL